MQLIKIEIPKAELQKLPKEVREFFLLVGLIGNEISILNKLLLFVITTRQESVSEAAKDGANAQTGLLIRLLAGKLHEAWEIIRTKFHAVASLRTYYDALAPDGKAALDEIKRYFGRATNLVTRIRNDYSFHYPSDGQIETGFSSTPESDGFYIYGGTVAAEALFVVSDIAAQRALLESVGAADHGEALDKVVKEVLEISSRFNDFIFDMVGIIYRSHFPHCTQSSVELQAPAYDSIRIPFFVRTPP